MLGSLLTVEFLSLIGGSLAGFIFKTIAERRQDEQERFERTLQALSASDASFDAAQKRVGSEAGKWVRRLIVMTILFGTIIAPFILPFYQIPTVVEVQETRHAPLDLFGLFGVSDKVSYKEINGYLFTTENRQILISIVGFYFGSATGRRR